MSNKITLSVLAFLVLYSGTITAYPIDGYLTSGIRRLVRLQDILSGAIQDKEPLEGARKSINDIKLHLQDYDYKVAQDLPHVDQAFQSQIDRFFYNLDKNYSITILDMTKVDSLRFASRRGDTGYQPGSVGKLAVAAGLFKALSYVYPEDFNKRTELLKTKFVKAGKWAMTDEHTVPFYNPETKKFFKRTVIESDVFSLYEWADHMMSVSNNGAASVVWREAILMCAFEQAYPDLTDSDIESFFKNTTKADLSEMAIQTVNIPLREVGITENEWRLGLLFTRGATSYIPGKGGSIGTTDGLMKFLVALEQGLVVDQKSSLEIKRLMYMTDRRIRYAASPELKQSAVYFKSGSLYKCDRTLNPDCGKYKGNVTNYMNSVIIVEHEDGSKYMAVLMSNVLGKNSNLDHNALGGKIDRLIRSGS